MHRKGVNPAETSATTAEAPQRIVKVRRDYNSWVASETLEDYALRYTPQRFRKWSEWRVGNTAFGAASFLILEAVGATLLVQYGFANAFWAIVATGLIIFLAGLPISVYAARYGVDMDLLTRGAGFGYIGSTLTSLIYASFTFIFFALEAAVMAYALELALGVPPVWGYLVCALVVIPLVTHGVSAISRLQLWTQPLWLVMLVVPFVFVLVRDPGAFAGIVHYNGARSGGKGFDLHLFGAALTVGIALITQMGEQADYLRFMPARTAANRRRWWAGVLAGGPGWVVLGVLKMLGGALLAYLAITHMVPVERAVDPNQMYLAAYEYVFPQYGWAVAATALFVVISQLKINVTNAYAGSLAWSNFFSRVAHSHPGRVVWVVFNALIAFMLMEMNVFEALGDVLGLFANIAIAWMMAVVADLVINKPLGLSPPGIEFKRAHLWDINPVGVGAMALASLLSITAHLGVFGPLAQAFSALIALGTALVVSPLLAWATGGKYYLAREAAGGGARAVRWARVVGAADQGGYRRLAVQRCVICEREYEGPDMAHCPAYQGTICSLCCTLDARCGDLCKPHASLSAQWSSALRWLLPRISWRYLDTGLGHFLLLMLIVVPVLAAVFGVLYQQELRALEDSVSQMASLRSGFLKAYMALLVIAGVVAWWLVLAHQSRKVAQEESNRQTHLLMREIELHRATDQALQSAKQTADEAREVAEQAKLAADEARRAADQANQAKSRYISAISHELRTPLNSILGYAQLMGEDASVPPHRRQAVAVIKRGGEHLLSLIEGTLAIAHIEAGKLTLDARPMRFADTMRELADMFELQAAEKGLRFRFEAAGALPEVVRADEKRVCQILINLLGNAIKFTAAGEVTLRLSYAREFASVEIEDTGPGMTAEDIERIFEPFARGGAAAASTPGAGLGLTIAKMLTDLMGGEMKVRSTPGEGSLFCVRLFLPRLHGAAGTAAGRPAPAQRARRGYEGPRRRLLVVDNEEADRELLGHVLAPLGFELRSAASGHDALDLIAAGYRPDAMLVDLAMPGIDGWETIRRARRLGLVDAPVAIVSANAFDKGLENDVGIAAEDFLVKPVRHSELLDWLERRLRLQWTEAAAQPAPAASSAPALRPPSPERLRALGEAVSLGYFRGIMNALDAIDIEEPDCRAWTEAQRVLARQFAFEKIDCAPGVAP
ncbi:signal transduction histidine kinase/CheY-like chemotaxis protein/purine-cytosine permease-like protein [Variovorax sp. TBS-050B]|uniref:hybrid sensor histidine kinase/response regulator n=1 Tax=Variovorax sp. TBS-050B TaxID=2940551 RepID=UPI002473AD61|nr:ATP-binding protein [Variovorax sp. TBS-050B]MDH6591178.1 signal transduction histidine kinase/CheY-like chemotaxis protein/purine-cytosine permease-like protein [Variovorax sp. TBS-050B]